MQRQYVTHSEGTKEFTTVLTVLSELITIAISNDDFKFSLISHVGHIFLLFGLLDFGSDLAFLTVNFLALG